MTTITREQQKQILIDTANHVISRDNTSPYSENLRELARIALASLEEKPVGEVSEKRYGLVMDGTVDLGGESTYRIIKGEKAMKRLPLGTKFYIAPPALVVPEEMPMPNVLSMYAVDAVAAIAEVRGWNACRSAMLQSKYRDLSQPVDPQISEYEKIMQRAGWVMVPVEPTDEMIAAAMNCEDVLFNSDESFCVQFGNIYEAMLAAAPQPEVK
ncbi:hypothetical protein C7057_14540 [Salmonella enterica]|uniref:hypothetical protein n=1 Tax=Salmonella enterica TaxID=28901 RepID=UPI00126B17C9|nr:hypothetical protein [Salmonella enterica subsp. enterica serovar Give]EAP3745765.1 hypothetical protein [Salmonella enterica subsp. enterica serovar Minnesota]EAR0388722.1 hypothetical protein [Salmonella enterica subsp. enterica serovar Pomona]EAV4718185.1 hypothetical protein [Salmonella enterica]EDS2300842.1 hypothetical protein [Salmonella enterica subsp. enterica serovar Java]EED9462795.1 hypothetical protein [Salmonella enterica subsp. enterica serovar Abaetetuba]EEN3926331.1 hypoth